MKLVQDGWSNLMTGLGIASRDKRKSTQFTRDGIQRSQQVLEDLYAGDDIAARVVDALPDEMTREWIAFRSDGDPMIAKNVMQALTDLGTKEKLKQALIWSRLFGGSAVLLGADDGQNVDQPLDTNKIKAFNFLTALDRWSLLPGLPYGDPLSPRFGLPEFYSLQTQLGTSSAGESNHFGAKVHESRLLRFDGVLTTPRRQQQNQTWGESVLERVSELLPDFATIYSGTAHLVNDFSQGVFKLKNLQALLAAGNDADVLKRMQLIDMSRSIVRSIVIDADGEDFTRESASFAGLPELMDKWTVRIAAAARMPVSILMGQSPSGGLSATGDMELRYWYDQVKAQQEAMLRPALQRLITTILRAKDGPTKGVEPEHWSFEFNPLWQMGDDDKAEIRLKQAQADQIYIQNLVLSPEEVAHSRFGGDGYSTETVLDETSRNSFDQTPVAPPVAPTQTADLKGKPGAQ